MNISNPYITIFAIAFITFLLRYIPFSLTKNVMEHKNLEYFKSHLPASIMFILVLYTVGDLPWQDQFYGLSELTSIFCVTLLHLKYRNALVSIIFGTFCYVYFRNYL